MGADSAGRAGAMPPATAPATAPQAFSAVLEESQPRAQATQSASGQVKSGDTLLGIVRDHAAQRGLGLSGSQGMRLVQQLARDSGIANANRIFPGQSLALGGVQSRLNALAKGEAADPLMKERAGGSLSPSGLGRTAAQRLGAAAYGAVPAQRVSTGVTPLAVAKLAPEPSAGAPNTATAQSEAASNAATTAVGKTPAGAHPVLEQTLDRAVARGFIPALERGDVYDKIVELSARYRFKPDDFARLTLIESDGMNPRASNERCHGISQFCDGNDRGAATAGFAANPRAILGFSVYQQLHLVDRYFSEVGIKPGGTGQAGLDELYLAVLMPAARKITDPQAPLGIPGTQASVLHPRRDRSLPITRQSILEGLQQHASDRLSGSRSRPQVASIEASGRLR